MCSAFGIILTEFRIQTVQDVIYFTNKSRTCIQSSIKTHLENPLGCLESCPDFQPLRLLQIEADVDVPRVKTIVSGQPSSYHLPVTSHSDFLIEHEFTPFALLLPIWKDVDL